MNRFISYLLLSLISFTSTSCQGLSHQQRKKQELENNRLTPCTDCFVMEDVLSFEKGRNAIPVEVDDRLMRSMIDYQDFDVDTSKWWHYTSEVHPDTVATNKQLVFVLYDTLSGLLEFSQYDILPVSIDSSRFILGVTGCSTVVFHSWPAFEERCHLQIKHAQECSTDTLLKYYQMVKAGILGKYDSTLIDQSDHYNTRFANVNGVPQQILDIMDSTFKYRHYFGDDKRWCATFSGISFDYMGKHNPLAEKVIYSNCRLFFQIGSYPSDAAGLKTSDDDEILQQIGKFKLETGGQGVHYIKH